MPSFAGLLRRGKKPVDEQPGAYPPPPHWEMLRHLNSVKRKPHPKPGHVKVNVELRPLDVLRAHGDDLDTPSFGHDLLLTYAVLGGVDGDFNDPVTLRPWPAKVDRTGAIKTKAGGIQHAHSYENTVVTGTPVIATFNPRPSVTLMIANDGAAAMTVQLTGFLMADKQTPNFAGIDSLTWPAGFVTTIQGEFVGAKFTTAAAVANAYRCWAFT